MNNTLSIKEYDMWKESKLHEIDTNFIDDTPYFTARMEFFQVWKVKVLEKYRKSVYDKLDYQAFNKSYDISVLLLPPYPKNRLEEFERLNKIYLPISLKFYLLYISRWIGKYYGSLFNIYDYNLFYDDYYSKDKQPDHTKIRCGYIDLCKDHPIFNSNDSLSDIKDLLGCVPDLAEAEAKDRLEKPWIFEYEKSRDCRYINPNKYFRYCALKNIKNEKDFPILVRPTFSIKPSNWVKRCVDANEFIIQKCSLCTKIISDCLHQCDTCNQDLCDSCYKENRCGYMNHKVIHIPKRPYIDNVTDYDLVCDTRSDDFSIYKSNYSNTLDSAPRVEISESESDSESNSESDSNSNTDSSLTASESDSYINQNLEDKWFKTCNKRIKDFPYYYNWNLDSHICLDCYNKAIVDFNDSIVKNYKLYEKEEDTAKVSKNKEDMDKDDKEDDEIYEFYYKKIGSYDFVPGAIVIGEYGCGEFEYIILNGEHKGSIIAVGGKRWSSFFHYLTSYKQYNIKL